MPAPSIRDRIVEFKRIKASELLPNPKNFRTHPPEQAAALQGILAEVGYAGAAIAYQAEDGLTLIDGHLRRDMSPDQEIPVLILDVNAEEADKLLATFDPLGALAGQNDAMLQELLASLDVQDGGLYQMLANMKTGSDKLEEVLELEKAKANPTYPITPVFNEKYDYVLIVSKNETEFAWLESIMQLVHESDYKTGGIGVGHVLTVQRFRQLWEAK